MRIVVVRFFGGIIRLDNSAECYSLSLVLLLVLFHVRHLSESDTAKDTDEYKPEKHSNNAHSSNLVKGRHGI